MHHREQNTVLADRVFDTLAARRRRFVLYLLLDGGVANIDEITVQIAAWEADEPIDSVDRRERERVAVSLAHKHFPKLEDNGIITYDLRSGDVVLTERGRALEPFLELAKRDEERSVPVQ